MKKKMENRIRLWGLCSRWLCAIALVAISGFTMTACDDGLGGGGIAKIDPVCDCTEKVHPIGEPCDCPAEGTPACTCTEAEPLVTGSECGCTETEFPLGEPCDCPDAETDACTCTEAGPPGTDLECDCVNKEHPHGSPCDCEAEGTDACACTEAEPTATDPECDCVVKVHPYGEPCDCEAEDCTCVEDEPECDCTETVHPVGEPCDCPATEVDACGCTEAGEPQHFIVTFDADNDTQHHHENVPEGEKAVKPVTDPEKENYTFVYWYDSETGDEWDFDTVLTANITLKAKWAYQSFMQMVPVGSGSFKMGQSQGGTPTGNNINNIHTVTLSAFSIGKYEVTQKEYATVMGSLPSDIASVSTGDNFPVYFVSWYDALVFCNKLSILEELTPAYSIDGKTDPAEWGTVLTTSTATWNAVTVVANSNGYRLPTEAQWEYAAKGGPSASNPYKLYSGSDTSTDVGVNANTAGPKAVGTLAANELGIKDMSGNVWEWCWDWYNGGNYTEDDDNVNYVPVSDPVGPSSGTTRIVRGGSYRQTSIGAQLAALRSVSRMYLAPEEKDASNSGMGFRIARPVVE